MRHALVLRGAVDGAAVHFPERMRVPGEPGGLPLGIGPDGGGAAGWAHPAGLGGPWRLRGGAAGL